MNGQKFFQSLLQMQREARVVFILSLIDLSLMMNMPLCAQTHSAGQQFQQGLVFLQARQYDYAIAAFTSVLKLQPTHEQAYQKRAEAYQKKLLL